MSKKKEKNPKYVTPEICEAYRKTIQVEIEGLKKYFEEKIKGIKTSILVASSVSTIIIMVVQFLLYLRGL